MRDDEDVRLLGRRETPVPVSEGRMLGRMRGLGAWEYPYPEEGREIDRGREARYGERGKGRTGEGPEAEALPDWDGVPEPETESEASRGD
jgi:hypothetical protein